MNQSSVKNDTSIPDTVGSVPQPPDSVTKAELFHTIRETIDHTRAELFDSVKRKTERINTELYDAIYKMAELILPKINKAELSYCISSPNSPIQGKTGLCRSFRIKKSRLFQSVLEVIRKLDDLKSRPERKNEGIKRRNNQTGLNRYYRQTNNKYNRAFLVEALRLRVRGAALQLWSVLQNRNPLASIAGKRSTCGGSVRHIGSDSVTYAVSMIKLSERATLITARETCRGEQAQGQCSSFCSPADPKFSYDETL